MSFRLKVILALLGLFLLVSIVGVVSGVRDIQRGPQARKASAKALGEIDLKDVTHSTFGYLKSTLVPLHLTVEDCRANGFHYNNCKKATWGPLVTAIFVTGEGLLGAKDITDDRKVSGIRINSEFLGTLCGESTERILDRRLACGVGVVIEKDPGGGSNIYLGLRKDRYNNNIY